MITILREPVSRYLSEWKHVTRGARLGLQQIHHFVNFEFSFINILKMKMFHFSTEFFFEIPEIGILCPEH